jgi:ketosteroid isomerase-like protein
MLLFADCIARHKDDLQIRDVLQRQVSAWNEGSIERYMQGYWNNDSLVFIGKNGPTYGYQPTLTRYEKSYPDTATMGKLSFEIISLEKISSEYYFAIGKWALKRTVGNVSGSWTLLFRKIKGQWEIVVDHSS